MLPMPAMNFWSISSGFSFAWRCASIDPKCSHDIAVSSGSMPEVRELGDLLLDGVGLGDEHLAERARVDEAQLTALREGDHDVRVLRHRVARALRPQQLSRHPEVDHEHVVAVEPHAAGTCPAARRR